jgi:predicted MFS family arabinose efflux permease
MAATMSSSAKSSNATGSSNDSGEPASSPLVRSSKVACGAFDPGGPKGVTFVPLAAASLLLSTVLPALVFVGLTPILPQIEAHFHTQSGASLIVRLLVSVIGPTVIIGAPLAGLLAARFGERRVMIWAAVAFGLAGCVASVLDSLYAILASRVLLGLAVAATSTLATVILTKLYVGEARNRWLGYYGTTGALISLILIPFCGFLGAINWRLVFLTHALGFALAVLFAVALPPDRSPTAPIRPTGETAPRVRAPVPWMLIAIGLACGSVSTSASLFLPFHLAGMGVTDSSKMGMLLLPAALASALSAFAFGRVRSRLSPSGTFALAFSLAGTGLVIVALTGSLNLVIAGLTLLGLGTGMVVPNLFSIAATRGAETDRSRLFGFTKGAYFAGPMLSQLILEPVLRYSNAAAAILALGIFAALLTLWSIGRARIERHALAS